MKDDKQTPDLETRTDQLARRVAQVPAETITVAGYNAAREVIPIDVDLNATRSIDPSSPLAQATVGIMGKLVDKYGSAPSGWDSDNPAFLGYNASVNEGPSKGMQLGVGNRYTWGNVPRNLSRTDESGKRREFFHVTIVEHPERKGVFLYQVVEVGVDVSQGRRGETYKRLYDAGMYMQPEGTLATFKGLPASTTSALPPQAGK